MKANENHHICLYGKKWNIVYNDRAKANGESQAIRIINEQLRENPQYLQWQGINRWNGQLPYSLGAGGGVPFFQLPGPLQQHQQNQTRQ